MSEQMPTADGVQQTQATTAHEEKARTEHANQKATAQATDIAAPEKIIGDDAPNPNYPRYRVRRGAPVVLAALDPNASEGFERKKHVEEELDEQRKRISKLQDRLYAESKRSLLIVLQAMDTAGKDGTIKHVFEGVNPQGCTVWSFKVPSSEEGRHDFLWRYHQRVPSQGMITIFNRSHYEDVLVVRVKELVAEQVWRERFQLINEFEHMLTLSNITVIKFFLHISRDEQKRRLESRLQDPDKRWKFSSNDVKERLLWDKYQLAYQDVLNNCSTDYAPWYVVPANKKWYRNLVIARTIADTLEAMNPQYPAAEGGLENIVVPD